MTNRTNTLRASLLALLRIVVGWHFLYEGIAKLLTPNWSAAGYLDISRWIFAGFFHWMAATPPVLKAVNFLNIWGLILVGLALLLGAFTRAVSMVGMGLLLMYWLANPPLVGLGLSMPAEGSYLIVDKNMVEFFGLALLAVFSAGKYFGLDALIFRRKRQPGEVAAKIPGAAEALADLPLRSSPPEVEAKGPETAVAPLALATMSPGPSRREVVSSLAGLPFLGAFAVALERKEKWNSYERKNLIEAVTAPSAKTLNVASLAELKGTVPLGEIRGRKISRMILGGNLLCGNAHSRDLIYVDDLVKAYHTKDRIFSTMLLAEKCGINTVLTNPILATIIDEYWKRNIGKIQFISDCTAIDYSKNPYQMIPHDQYLNKIKRAIDYGATACYIQGETADWFIRENRIDLLAETLDVVRKHNVLAGVGAHEIETVMACVNAGVEPDFWMKTLHHLNYWSAQNPQWHDNIFCAKPNETVAFMRNVPQPWIAFKVLAAGAITPEEGFRFALENGGDFLCVGMYDFQMVKDVNKALEIMRSNLQRERPWHGGPLFA
jgi:uncharacterized membrane protein YphA (DoxX/SURF4 family)